jgi:cytochrome c oxidase subunit 2
VTEHLGVLGQAGFFCSCGSSDRYGLGMDQSLLENVGEQATQNLSIFAPVSPPAESISNLSILVFAITGFIFLVVEGILIYCIVRSRRRAEGETTEPPQVYGSSPIEIAWTAAPALIVFILTLVTARALWQIELEPPRGPRPDDHSLFVTVIGHQWWWEYTYESYDGKTLGFGTANELHIPASEAGVARPVYLALKSADVCHSFWVPRLAGKTDLIPGRTNSLWFQTEQTGLFLGQCAEFCGTQHANMLLRVVVDPPREFERWLEHEASPAPDDPAVVDGKASFLAQTCVNCHRVRGTSAQGRFGPDLTHLMGRRTLAAGMVPNTPAELGRWVDDPQRVKPGCLMPAFGLSGSDRDRILRYLMTLR